MDFLEQIFGWVMRGSYWLTRNYIVSLLLFALVFQLIMVIFGVMQQKNMVKQASLRPQEMAIKNKYAGRTDQATQKKMQDELLKLQQDNGISPLSGCLPMIVQMIIIFPLYWIAIRPLQYCGGLSYSTCYALAQDFGLEFVNGQPAKTTFQIELARLLQGDWQSVISPSRLDSDGVNVFDAVTKMQESLGTPTASLFGTDLAATPFDSLGTAAWWLILIPLVNLGLTYLSQFIQKKLSYQSAVGDAQGSSKILMLVMPLVTFFITATFSAAIGVYWVFRTLLSMLQQFILAKAMPYPTFTEEDYKKAEKEYRKGITTPTTTRTYPNREYRSLHHIDDDDED